MNSRLEKRKVRLRGLLPHVRNAATGVQANRWLRVLAADAQVPGTAAPRPGRRVRAGVLRDLVAAVSTAPGTMPAGARLRTRRCPERQTRPCRRVHEGGLCVLPAANSFAPAGGRHVAGFRSALVHRPGARPAGSALKPAARVARPVTTRRRRSRVRVTPPGLQRVPHTSSRGNARRTHVVSFHRLIFCFRSTLPTLIPRV
jgi:hypothetical protein